MTAHEVLAGAPTEDGLRRNTTAAGRAPRRRDVPRPSPWLPKPERVTWRPTLPVAGSSGPHQPHSVLRDPTLPCAKDTSVSSAGPFYATVLPLYDPLPRSEWVSWRRASSWQELPTELGEVTKAEQEVA